MARGDKLGDNGDRIIWQVSYQVTTEHNTLVPISWWAKRTRWHIATENLPVIVDICLILLTVMPKNVLLEPVRVANPEARVIGGMSVCHYTPSFLWFSILSTVKYSFLKPTITLRTYPLRFNWVGGRTWEGGRISPHTVGMWYTLMGTALHPMPTELQQTFVIERNCPRITCSYTSVDLCEKEKKSYDVEPSNLKCMWPDLILFKVYWQLAWNHVVVAWGILEGKISTSCFEKEI